MARITIDGIEYEVADGENLLAAVLALGINLPYFCWHPALGSVGACRQCAVKQFRNGHETRGKLVMACMVQVKEGDRFSLQDPEAVAFRASVIEWLMLNHPHDCPVCDEGGECHLQDMTVMTGHVNRRATIRKRTFPNQDLGPFITHEMNRCITCYRCVRFYQDYAGGNDLHAFASKNHVWFGRHEAGPLESPFSGNLVEVCPTGVFTDKTLARHYTRKWDLQTAPTLCLHCGIGCNTFAGERYGTLRRVTNRFHADLNGYFLCDRGRFGYEYVAAPARIRSVRLHGEEPAPESALRRLAASMAGMRVVGVGSPRASLEANYALRRLVGAENFFSGLAGREQRLAVRTLQAVRGARIWSLREVAQCDAVVLLGEDVEATNARLSLALRQAVRQQARRVAGELHIPEWQEISVREATPGERSPLFIFSPLPTALDAVASGVWRFRPDEIVAAAAAITRALDEKGSEEDEMARVARTLRGAKQVALVIGAVHGSETLFDAGMVLFAGLVQAGVNAGLVVTVPECNTVTAALLGGRPLEELPTGPNAACLVLENDLFRRMEPTAVKERLQGSRLVVTIDAHLSATTEQSHALLPAAPFAEGSGIYINYEGRAQRSWQVYTPAEPVRESWRWIVALGILLGRTPDWRTTADLVRDAATEFGELAPAVEPLTRPVPRHWRIAREPHRYSGRTAQCADRTLFEPPPPRDPEGPFSFSMEGFGEPIPEALIPRHWAPGWNSWQARTLGEDRHRRGAGGVRLWHPTARLVCEPPAPLAPPARWLAIPLHTLFGSEELSARGGAIAARSAGPCAAIAPEEAAVLGVREGEELSIELEGRRWQAPVRLLPMARGLVALSVGIAPFVTFPLYRVVRLWRPA